VSLHLRMAVWAVLLASASRLDAQSAKAVSISPLRTILPSTCRNADVSEPKFVLLWKPSVRPPGLNLGSGCMPLQQIDFLEIDPQSLETVPTQSGTPQFCGVARYRDVSIRFCTRAVYAQAERECKAFLTIGKWRQMA
jgi:hypothetical protein